MLLWKRYVNNKMAAMRFLHLQQYSHRLNLYVFFPFILRGLSDNRASIDGRRTTIDVPIRRRGECSRILGQLKELPVIRR